MRRSLGNRVASLFISLSAILGCHHFTSELAELDANQYTRIEKREVFYGDCFRFFPPVATVYAIERPNYVLRVVQGDRWWPQFLLEAHSPTGAHLSLSGNSVRSLSKFPSDLQFRSELEEERGVTVSYSVGLSEEPKPNHQGSDGVVTVSILADDGRELGVESLRLRFTTVRCWQLELP